MSSRRTIDELNALWSDPSRWEKASKARDVAVEWVQSVSALLRNRLDELPTPSRDRTEP